MSNYIFILIILIVGFSGVIAQVLFLRELLINFYGNELNLGIILANWVMLEALGVFIAGKIIDKMRNKINVFIILQLIFSLSLPLFIYLSRTFKALLGIPSGEIVGLYTIFYSSFFIILLASFCHGALFSSLAKIYSLYFKEPAHAIGKVYTWETLGTLIGGIVLTYLFIPYFNSFQIAFIISLLNLVISFIFLNYTTPKRRWKYLFSIGVLLFLYLFSMNLPNRLHRFSLNKQWEKIKVLDYRNSIYGNIVVGKYAEQYTFFYNGVPVITTPYPDITFVEEFGHLPLLFHSQPKDILVIGGGAGGLINEILKHPVKKVDYAELDPLLIEMVKRHPSLLTRREIYDQRVKIINLDGRLFLRTAPFKYDIVLIGLSKPSDLSTNRLFTKEFFSLVKERLNSGGILGLWLPGSITYLSRELRDLNACIFNGLKDIYADVLIIPGDYNIYLASSSEDILKADSTLIIEKLREGAIKTNILTPAYLDYRLDRKWQEWFKRSSFGATKKINQDFLPFAVFQALIFWNKQFSEKLAYLLASLQSLDLKQISILVFLITTVLFYLFRRKQPLQRLHIAYTIATTGFFGMLINLVLIFSFQVFYGYLYHRLGILIALFMAGIAAGSIFITSRLQGIKNNLNLFIRFDILIILFSYFLGWIITKSGDYLYSSSLLFIPFFFITGLLMGLEFPLANKIYLGRNKEVGESAGLLYCADLLGGWLAGICGGIIFLPVLGIFNTCLIIVIFKLSSVFLLVTFRDIPRAIL